ncbi:Hypothetical predicted protein, partial [Paramuricea clavata]
FIIVLLVSNLCSTVEASRKFRNVMPCGNLFIKFLKFEGRKKIILKQQHNVDNIMQMKTIHFECHSYIGANQSARRICEFLQRTMLSRGVPPRQAVHMSRGLHSLLILYTLGSMLKARNSLPELLSANNPLKLMAPILQGVLHIAKAMSKQLYSNRPSQRDSFVIPFAFNKRLCETKMAGASSRERLGFAQLFNLTVFHCDGEDASWMEETRLATKIASKAQGITIGSRTQPPFSRRRFFSNFNRRSASGLFLGKDGGGFFHVLIGDSMIKNIQGPKLGKEVGNRVVVKSFPGATSEDMRHYIKPTIDRSPNRIVLHCGTNDLKNSSPTEVAERVASLASEIEKTSETKVIISELVARRDMNDQVKTVNKQLRKHCQSNGWTLIQHNNISFADLNRGGLHLNHEEPLLIFQYTGKTGEQAKRLNLRRPFSVICMFYVRVTTAELILALRVRYLRTYMFPQRELHFYRRTETYKCKMFCGNMTLIHITTSEDGSTFCDFCAILPAMLRNKEREVTVDVDTGKYQLRSVKEECLEEHQYKHHESTKTARLHQNQECGQETVPHNQ